jgi:hypothetical protein
MPSTVTLDRTIRLTERYVRLAPLTFVNQGDPAFSGADAIRQFILSPPFGWRWNRGFLPIIIATPGTQDYQVPAPNFGWIERAVLNFPITNDGSGQSIELEVKMDLGYNTVPNQPTQISAIGDDNNGNITFRLSPPPDQAYSIRIVYQFSAPTFGATTDTWAPIPDYLSYLYNLGMRAMAYEYTGDERFSFAYQMFLRQVVAANDSLTDTQRNIFLEHQVITATAQQMAGLAARQGKVF